jgi:hypothetical protein
MVAHIPIALNNDPRVQYTVGSTATTGPWTFSFAVFASSDLVVLKTVDGEDFVLVEGTDYEVTLNTDYEGGYNGGSITAITALSDCKLTLYRETPSERLEDFPNTGAFNIKTLNTTLDKIYAQLQQFSGALKRTLLAPPSVDVDATFTLPSPLAGAFFGWKSDGSGIENKNVPLGTTIYATTSDTNAGEATDESVTPKGLHDSIYNTDDTMVLVQAGKVTEGTSKIVYRQPRKITLTGVLAGLKTAQTSGDTLTVDIKVNGESILSTLLTIDNGETTSETAETPAVIDAPEIDAGDEVSFDVTQVGDGTAVMLTVCLMGRIEP